MKTRFSLAALAASAATFATIVLLVPHQPAQAVPAYAEQTSQDCKSCHVGGFGPQLTNFGREFKLRGYTLRAKNNIPLSAMAVASFVSTAKSQDEPPTDHSKRNNNLAFDEGSIFVAGGLGSHIGGFAQITYSGADRAWAWDNLDLRLVNSGKIGGKEIVYGLTLNNNPTIQDGWNTLGGWGFPYTDSDNAPAPAAAPLIDGGLGQGVLGLTGYAWIDSKFYLEGGAYSSPSTGTINWLGADPFDPGKLHGVAPYGRLVFQEDLGKGTLELGAFGLDASLYPERDSSTGHSDRYTDLGLDASWIGPVGSDTITLNGRYLHEKQSLDATCALGMDDGSIPVMPLSDCADGHLDELHADASYYWHDRIGATVSGFSIAGSRNPFLNPDNRTFRPDSSGLQLQLDYTFFGRGKSPLGPRPNARVGVQYTIFDKFDGARNDIDGSGRDASDNNTLRVFTWLAF
jgi:hypothetical protein